MANVFFQMIMLGFTPSVPCSSTFRVRHHKVRRISTSSLPGSWDLSFFPVFNSLAGNSFLLPRIFLASWRQWSTLGLLTGNRFHVLATSDSYCFGCLMGLLLIQFFLLFLASRGPLPSRCLVSTSLCARFLL